MWENPAEYAVCKTCHNRLHKRFTNPFGWAAYKLHLKRGGQGSDLKTAKIAQEVRQAALTRASGKVVWLSPLRTFVVGNTWRESLTVDPVSLTAVWARPR